MIVLLVLCALGLPAGFLLLKRIPLCDGIAGKPAANVTVIIPARNEECTLPALLTSIASAQVFPNEVLVVNDGSTDSTAAIARMHGACVIDAAPPGPGWTGKTWACLQGVEAATGENLLFLDADTWFAPDGYERIELAFRDRNLAMSVLPYHVTRKAYEELSLFFNLLMVFGAGGFGRLGRARLFGQSLLISRELYQRSGGHAAVRGTILENLAMSKWVEAAGGKCSCLGGRGTLQMRMFPAGIRQLCEGWTKAFTSGAAATDPLVLAVSVFWLSNLAATAVFVILLHAPWRWTFAGLYACFAAQLFWFARQIGTFRAITCLLYPIPLVFFFGLFTGAVIRRLLKQKVTWRGRQL